MSATVRELLRGAKQRLRAAPFGAAPREAHLLLARLLDRSEAQLLARDERAVDDSTAADFEALLARRLDGEPVAYLLGQREFYGRAFSVDSRVLIPRPETEHLIEVVLQLELPARPTILDLGTGSGCIAITLALELPSARVIAGDRSLGALAVAGINARSLGDRPLARFCGNWLQAISLSRVDLVVSNPPYIRPEERATLSPEITEFEPGSALFADARGLAAYKALFNQLAELPSGVPVAVEIGQGQVADVVALAEARDFTHHRTVEDYAGIPRVVVVNRR